MILCCQDTAEHEKGKVDKVIYMENTKKKQLVVVLLAVILLIGIVGGCLYSKHNKFSGTYVATEDVPLPFPDEVYFVNESQCFYDGFNATYVYKDGTITFYWYGSPDRYGCAINGKKMILTSEDGSEMVTYIKQ